MPLRIRILLWVSALFLTTITFVFVISNVEINYNLKKEEKNLIGKVREVDEKNIENILKFLSSSISNEAERIFNTFIFIENSPQWLAHFLPDEYNVRTRSWGSSASLLATYPWIKLINVQMNGKLDSFIHQSSPYLRKYLKLQVAEDLTLFAVPEKDGLFHTYVGVPIMTNQEIYKFVDEKDFPNIFRSNEPDHWILYDPETLFSIDTRNLRVKNEKIYKHVIEEAITLDSKEQFDFLFATFKLMIDVTKQKLSKRPKLVEHITNPKTNQEFVKEEIKKIKPLIGYERSYCNEPICNKPDLFKTPEWSTTRSFSHELIQNKLIWQLCMLTRTGAWDFNPFKKGAPQGIVTELIPTFNNEPAFFENMVEGIFSKDVFINTTIETKVECNLASNDQYRQTLALVGDKDAIVKTCKNKNLNIIYGKTFSEPFLTQTKHVSYLKSPMKEPNTAAITLGVPLDNIFINLALVSPDEVAVIFNDGTIRLYTTDGEIFMLSDETNNYNQQKIINEKEGSIVDKQGNKLYFKHLAKITKDDGHIVLIEKEVSRTTIINSINEHIKALSKKVMLHSLFLIIAALALISIILSRVIGAITKPINHLVKVTGKITTRKLDSIQIDEKESKRKDEIGSLYTSFGNMIKSMQEGNKVRGILDKVVSKQVAEKIIKEGVKLGGEKKHLTVMFCDIRNFTSITEKMDPVDVLTMLNECLTLLSAVIDDFEGVIDKYEGDLIMALFGAPLESNDHSLQAVLCAIEMQKAIQFWNDEREENGLCRLSVGIGIHTGEAVAGNVGAENHLSYTVLGNIVNLSSRLCDSAAAKEILITKETLEGAKEFVVVEEKPAQKFKGFSDPVVTYSVVKHK